MKKLKSVLITLFASAAAVMTLSAGAMAATEMPTSIEATTDTFTYEYSTSKVEDYSETFSNLPYTEFSVKGNTGTLTAKSSSYNGNMKYVWVQIVTTAGKSNLNYGQRAQSSCSITTSYDGTIKTGRYIGTTYPGSGMNGVPLNEYDIYVKRK